MGEQYFSTGRAKKLILVQIKASPKECTSLTEFAKFEDASRLDLRDLISISHSLPSRIPLILDIQNGMDFLHAVRNRRPFYDCLIKFTSRFWLFNDYRRDNVS
jgi:hypothetical protein